MSEARSTKPRLGVRLRFIAWHVLIFAWLSLGTWWIFSGARSIAGWHGLNACALAMAALLGTTPPDAIRLSRGRSERFLLAGTSLFFATAFLAAHGGIPRTLGVGAAMVVAWHILRRWLERQSTSPWWAALVLWHPLALAQLA